LVVDGAEELIASHPDECNALQLKNNLLKNLEEEANRSEIFMAREKFKSFADSLIYLNLLEDRIKITKEAIEFIFNKLDQSLLHPII